MNQADVARSMRKYQELIAPDFVLSRTFSAFKIDLVANTPTLMLRVDRPKAYLFTNINNPDNTPVFIGPNRNVSFESGFPIVAGTPLSMGIGENTEIWCIAITNMTIYILDMGL